MSIDRLDETAAIAPSLVETESRPHRYRLAAIDVDDTLVGKSRRISPANAAAIRSLRRAGVLVVLASGRSHANMLRFHRELGLGAGPIISAQGAIVQDAEAGAPRFEHPMSPDVAVEATRDGLRRGFTIQQYRSDGIYVQTRDRWTEYDQSRNDEPQVWVEDLLAGGGKGVFKLTWLGDPERIAVAAPEVAARYAGRLDHARTDPEYLEFTDAGVDKGVGLAWLCEEMGLHRDQVIAFGDGNNDVPMLRWAGLGVAMSHARSAARDAAELVAPDGDLETSLARAIRLLLDRDLGLEGWPEGDRGRTDIPVAEG